MSDTAIWRDDQSMQTDLLFDPFAARWQQIKEAAIIAEGEGFDGLFLYDHLAGAVHGQARVVECWTVLTAIATTVPRVTIGPMVCNVANRDPALLGVMAATLQEVSGGRLLLGIGAGGSRHSPYASEQFALGRSVLGDAARRSAVENAVATIRTVWSGTMEGVTGFLRPDPLPPVILGGFGPKMAELAGRVADGINLPDGPNLERLLATAMASLTSSDRPRSSFVVTVSADLRPQTLERLEATGVDRVVSFVTSPLPQQVARLRSGKR